MRDVTDQLNGIVDNLFGVVDALKLGCFVEVDKVFIQVESGSSEKRTGIVVKISGDSLSFFFLEPD